MNEIQRLLQDHFHPDKISAVEASRVLNEAFPSAKHTRITKGGEKKTYIVGVDITTSSPSQSAPPREVETECLLQRITALEKRVQELEQSQHLLREADNMIGISKCTYGPDTISRLSQFNLESVVADFSAYSPELYRFFATIGSSSQHLSTDNLALRVEDTKVITSLCIILNARSNRFRGLQLLISLMLVARGTGKQVMKK